MGLLPFIEFSGSGELTVPRTSFFLLLGAVVLAAVAVLIARVYLTQPAAAPPVQVVAAPVTVPVAVASSAVAFGEKLLPEKVKIAQFPKDSVPEGSFPSYAAIIAGGERVAVRTIAPSEPLLAKSLSGKGGRLSASGLIEVNMRAVSVPVSDVSGVAGFPASGDRVDVFLTRALKVGRAPGPIVEQQATSILLQNVRVLAVGQDADEAKSKPEVVRTATLEVTPTQAQKLILAQTSGALSLALRGLADAAPQPLGIVSVADLHDGGTPGIVRTRTTVRTVRRTAPRRVIETVEIVRAGKSETYALPHAG